MLNNVIRCDVEQYSGVCVMCNVLQSHIPTYNEIDPTSLIAFHWFTLHCLVMVIYARQ